MKTTLLETGSAAEVGQYVKRKFATFNSWTYSKSTRRQKCMQYWVAGSNLSREIIEKVYQDIYHELFPIEGAEKLQKELEQKARKPHKVERGEYIQSKTRKIGQGEELLERLKTWKREGDYQKDTFYFELQTAVRAYDPTLVNPKALMTEAEVNRVARLSGSYVKTDREVMAEFEGMIGVQQKASVTFEPNIGNLGTFKASLEEEFKAGVWGSGKAAARMQKLGFNLEAQAALSVGLELNIDGMCTWQKGKVGLDLKGNCNVFAGAEGSVAAAFGASVKKGLEASFEAKAFAGFRASVTGSAAFNYDGKPLVSAEGTASFQFGVGGELSASLKVPIFGPTEIDFTTSATLGIGFGVSSATQINFSQIYLAGSEQFRKVIYLPTLAKGYRMDLMTMEAKNLHYLNKCIARIGENVESLGDRVASLERVPSEKQVLLMQMDDD